MKTFVACRVGCEVEFVEGKAMKLANGHMRYDFSGWGPANHERFGQSHGTQTAPYLSEKLVRKFGFAIGEDRASAIAAAKSQIRREMNGLQSKIFKLNEAAEREHD